MVIILWMDKLYIYDLTENVHKKSHHIRLTRPACLDLKAWDSFLSEFNGRVLCSSIYSLHFFTDASAAAYAAVLGSHWIHGLFLPSWKDTNIAIKELLQIV